MFGDGVEIYADDEKGGYAADDPPGEEVLPAVNSETSCSRCRDLTLAN